MSGRGARGLCLCVHAECECLRIFADRSAQLTLPFLRDVQLEEPSVIRAHHGIEANLEVVDVVICKAALPAARRVGVAAALSKARIPVEADRVRRTGKLDRR